MSECFTARSRARVLVCVLGVLVAATAAWAQAPAAPAPTGPTLQIYGFAHADVIYDFNQNDPDWYDTNRPTKLPSFHDEFGRDRRMYFSVRQTRFGVRSEIPTDKGPVTANFEFNLHGAGADAGQTTMRVRHAYGEWRQVGAGQTWSQFMDPDVSASALDFWGPNGMVWFRNIQVFWKPTSSIAVAIEKPGASADEGIYADRIELEDVQSRFPLPDFTGHYRLARDWGHVQVGGLARYIRWDDLNDDAFDLSGSVWGWGVSLSSVLNATQRDTVRLQVVVGEGSENYLNDAPVDVAVRNNFSNPITPIVGEALPVIGGMAFLDHYWSDRWSTTVGYSRMDLDNSDGQDPDAFKAGQYALINLRHMPVPKLMMGGEFAWVHRANNSDGFAVDDLRLQFAFRYSFDVTVGD